MLFLKNEIKIKIIKMMKMNGVKFLDNLVKEIEKVKNHYLTDAVYQLLKGNEVQVPKSESFGCKIFYRGIEDKMR